MRRKGDVEEGGEWVAELNEHFFSEVSRLTSPGPGLRSQDVNPVNQGPWLQHVRF